MLQYVFRRSPTHFMRLLETSLFLFLFYYSSNQPPIAQHSDTPRSVSVLLSQRRFALSNFTPPRPPPFYIFCVFDVSGVPTKKDEVFIALKSSGFNPQKVGCGGERVAGPLRKTSFVSSGLAPWVCLALDHPLSPPFVIVFLESFRQLGDQLFFY